MTKNSKNDATKILVVVDFAPMRRVVKTLLRQSGYKTFVEAEGQSEGFEALKANKNISLVVSDWKMEQGSGLGLLSLIRDDKALRSLPLLMVTSENDKQVTLEAMKPYSDSQYIVKPFTGKALEEKIHTLLRAKAGEKKAS